MIDFSFEVYVNIIALFLRINNNPCKVNFFINFFFLSNIFNYKKKETHTNGIILFK